MVTRNLTLALLALLASAGCRTAGVGNLARPQPLAPPTALNASELIAEHNRNAEKVQSLEAAPSIIVWANRVRGGVEGKLALERPRNFKLEMSNIKGILADIGSNDQEFWFWSGAKAEEKAVYYCNYDESGNSPLAAAFQPDWIIEGLGLRIIPEDEAARTEVQRVKGGILRLTRRDNPNAPGGESVTRVTELSDANHRVRSYSIYSADQKKLLAQAVITGYKEFEVPAEAGGPAQTVVLPEKIRLMWAEEKEKLTLDVEMKDVSVNPAISQARRDALFVEPPLREGYTRVNLAERAGMARKGPTTIRETRPAPPARVELSEPATLPPAADDSARLPREPVSLTAALRDDGPRRADEVVGPRIPTAPQPDSLQPGNSRWRRAATPNLGEQ